MTCLAWLPSRKRPSAEKWHHVQVSAAQIRPLVSSKVQCVKHSHGLIDGFWIGKSNSCLLYWWAISFIFNLSGVLFCLIESDRALLLLNKVCGLMTAVLTILPAWVKSSLIWGCWNSTMYINSAHGPVLGASCVMVSQLAHLRCV